MRVGRFRTFGALARAGSANQRSRCGGEVDLSLLRRWVRPAGLRKDGRIIDIEGDPDSPISRGCLCPKGAATFQLVTGSHRVHHVLYRRPYASPVGDHSARAGHGYGGGARRKTREETWEATSRRTMGIAHLGGATLDNEENYLIKKLFTALGIVQIENQARI